MTPTSIMLLIGGALSLLAAVLHVGIILGGPAWYRTFGAGERMARLCEQDSRLPTLVTTGIATLLASSAAFALSGVQGVFRLPFTEPAILLIATIFLLRGAAGIPFVLLSRGSYARELRGKMVFTVSSSLLSLFIGLCYAVGYTSLKQPT